MSSQTEYWPWVMIGLFLVCLYVFGDM